MRQWMIDPRKMCRRHLQGEHVEIHMVTGSLKLKKKIFGYIRNNLLEPLSLLTRHQELVSEMTRRGYHHKSPIDVDLKEVYSMCRPFNKKVCLNEIRKYVKTTLSFRAEDTSGNWTYPYSGFIAGWLIENKFAEEIKP